MIQDEHCEGGMPSSMKLGRETYQHIITYGSGVIFSGEVGPAHSHPHRPVLNSNYQFGVAPRGCKVACH